MPSLFRYCLLSILFSLYVQGVQASDYRIVTTALAPWCMPESQQYPGPFIEIIREIDRRLGNNTDIEILPWARAQETAQREDNVIIFPVAKVKERADLYQWIYPIRKLKFAFVTADGRKLTEEQARELPGILVHSHAPPEMILKRKGFTNLVPFPIHKPNFIDLMRLKRVDSWFTATDLVNWLDLQHNKPNDFTIGPDIVTSMLYIAGSLGLSNQVLNDFQRILNDMKKKGEINLIFAKYRR